jgi:hypothetical protein
MPAPRTGGAAAGGATAPVWRAAHAPPVPAGAAASQQQHSQQAQQAHQSEAQMRAAQRQLEASFQHTQLGVYLAGAFGVMYIWGSSAQVCARVCVRVCVCVCVVCTSGCVCAWVGGWVGGCVDTQSLRHTPVCAHACTHAHDASAAATRCGGSCLLCCCVLPSAVRAQGIVDRYHFSKRWFYLYGACCVLQRARACAAAVVLQRARAAAVVCDRRGCMHVPRTLMLLLLPWCVMPRCSCRCRGSRCAWQQARCACLPTSTCAPLCGSAWARRAGARVCRKSECVCMCVCMWCVGTGAQMDGLLPPPPPPPAPALRRRRPLPTPHTTHHTPHLTPRHT